MTSYWDQMRRGEGTGPRRYMVLKVIQTQGRAITEAVSFQGTNVFFSREEAEEVFAVESAVLRANVALEIREVGGLVQRRRAEFIDDAKED